MNLSNYTIKKRKPIESKMGIKSSLSELKRVIALSYLLYKFSAKKDECEYADEDSSSGKIALKLKQSYIDSINSFLETDVSDELKSNPLLTAQLEQIMVGLTVMFKLSKVSFKAKMSFSAERTGGNRYAKILSFTANMLILDMIVSSYEKSVQQQFIISWLKNQDVESLLEQKVKVFIAVLLRNTEFKLRDDSDDEHYFQTENLYHQVQSGSFDFEDSHEFVGPTRILKSYLAENIDPWLSISRNSISKEDTKKDVIDFENFVALLGNSLDIDIVESIAKGSMNEPTISEQTTNYNTVDSMKNFIDALKTKPFLLLAGISGTGKSRKVKELAYMTCPNKNGLQDDKTTPGNYCCIEVKPNWHDSSELLGYYSNLNKKYTFTQFVRFAVKAFNNPDVPFFVCLDEMNLAPVEQYFAEYLSVLESRKIDGGVIKSAELLKKADFQSYEETDDYSADDLEVLKYIKENGLCLPENLFVIGTVNMDDTTHQFSRKVIDRAFTIEMNGDELSSMFEDDDTLVYTDFPLPIDAFKPRFVSATDALKDDKLLPYKEDIVKKVPECLKEFNDVLKDTPFRVSFRVQNEFVLYLSTLILREENPDIDSLINKTALIMLLEKILPRVQGDEKLLRNALRDLKTKVEEKYSNASESECYKEVVAKLDEMNARLENSYFTNFF